VVGHTQTATLYIEEGVESFRPEGAYAASLVLAAFSFILLIGMDFIRKHLEGGRGNQHSSANSTESPRREYATTPVRALVQTGVASNLGREADERGKVGLTPEVGGSPPEPRADARGHLFGH
jgi:hypothetical protein